jgi:hypothetical protein
VGRFHCDLWLQSARASVGEKIRAAWVGWAPPRSFDSVLPNSVHAINRRGAPLRMTILWEIDEKHPKQVSAYRTTS